MKLIIDIPDDKFKWIMEYPETYNSEYDKAIRNGKPYDETQGEWIRLDNNNPFAVECPFCEARHCCIQNFCGNCGADMRGEKE